MVPVNDSDWADLSEVEREEWLQDCFAQFADHCREAAEHDQDGYYAEAAGEAACTALGHTEDDIEDEETHPPSWDGKRLCGATRNGSCCVICEGECSFERAPLLWSLPGVEA